MRVPYIIGILLTAGCASSLREEAVPAERVLAGPYALRLSVTPQTAHPGEKVLVSVEFENTGDARLWVPRGREIFLGFRYESGLGETWASSCDGIKYVRLRPKEKIHYEQFFEVPSIDGTLEIYTSVRRDISVPLTIEKKANPALEPTSTSVTSPVCAGTAPAARVAHL